MTASIRGYEPSDEELVVALSLRAWEPVLAAVADMLGPELFARLRGDWRAGGDRGMLPPGGSTRRPATPPCPPSGSSRPSSD